MNTGLAVALGSLAVLAVTALLILEIASRHARKDPGRK
jgi:hypothetical protein